MEVDGSRYDKYGEIVHKISGLVPSVIAERGDVSIKTSSKCIEMAYPLRCTRRRKLYDGNDTG